MQSLTAKSTPEDQGEDFSGKVDSPPSRLGNHSLRDHPRFAIHPDHDPTQSVQDDDDYYDDVPGVTQQPIKPPLQPRFEDDALLSQKIQQLKYELEVCRQLGREAKGRQMEERKRLQANLDSKRRDLIRTFQRAKTNISYFEYCRIIRRSFDAGAASGDDMIDQQQQQQQQQQQHQTKSRSTLLHRSWYGWCEGFLLRGIHHAMMTKDQLDIVQRNCNALLMEVYADRLPRLQKEKEIVEQTWTTAIIQMEQYLARRQHFQQRSLDLRLQLQKHYSGQHHHDNTSVMVPAPASSPRTPSMGNPSKGILKNSSGKSTSRWEEDRPGMGLSPPTRQQTTISSWRDDDQDDNGDKSHEPASLTVPGGSSSAPILSTPPSCSLQPARVG